MWFVIIRNKANEVLTKYIKSSFIIKTGSKSIDDSFSGGIYSGEVIEITGSYSSGKSQMCLNLIVNMLSSYPSYKCLYIDSANNFCVHRLAQLMNSKNDNKQDESVKNNQLKKNLEAVKLIKCQNVFHLLSILFKITKPSSSLLNRPSLNDTQNNENLSPNLILIDNLSSLFGIFKSNNQLDTQYYLNYLSNQIKYLATSLNIVIIFTSNIDIEVSSIYSSIFNESWKSMSNVCLKLNKSDGSRNYEVLKINRHCFSEFDSTDCIFFLLFIVRNKLDEFYQPFGKNLILNDNMIYKNAEKNN